MTDIQYARLMGEEIEDPGHKRLMDEAAALDAKANPFDAAIDEAMAKGRATTNEAMAKAGTTVDEAIAKAEAERRKRFDEEVRVDRGRGWGSALRDLKLEERCKARDLELEERRKALTSLGGPGLAMTDTEIMAAGGCGLSTGDEKGFQIEVGDRVRRRDDGTGWCGIVTAIDPQRGLADVVYGYMRWDGEELFPVREYLLRLEVWEVPSVREGGRKLTPANRQTRVTIALDRLRKPCEPALAMGHDACDGLPEVGDRPGWTAPVGWEGLEQGTTVDPGPVTCHTGGAWEEIDACWPDA